MVTLLKMLLAGWALSLLMGCCAWWADPRDDDHLGYSSEPVWRSRTTTSTSYSVTRDAPFREDMYPGETGLPYPERASAAWW